MKDGRKVYFRYSDKSFSTGNKGINPLEAEQLRETSSILKRFKGMPHMVVSLTRQNNMVVQVEIEEYTDNRTGELRNRVKRIESK